MLFLASIKIQPVIEVFIRLGSDLLIDIFCIWISIISLKNEHVCVNSSRSVNLQDIVKNKSSWHFIMLFGAQIPGLITSQCRNMIGNIQDK